ncbi:hypothetical protein ACQJ0H_22910, partial [Pantoea agglomerans]
MAILETDQLHARFHALDQFLVEHQALWKPRPFTALQLGWEQQHPELASWLRQCTLEDAEANLDPNLPPAPYPQLAAQA